MSISGSTLNTPIVSKVDLEKLKNEIDKRSFEKKTKDEIISNIIDLQQLYEIQGKELIETTKKLRDVEGDLVIKNEIIKENQVTMNRLVKEWDFSKLENNFQKRMVAKLDEIIVKLINNK